jgi:transposase
MATPVKITVAESVEELKKHLNKASVHLRPKLKMLQAILSGIDKNSELAARTGVSVRSITRWKEIYTKVGLEGLLNDQRGGDYRSGIDAVGKKKIADKLSEPKDAFTSFGQAQEWINKELGTDKKYHAINKYLKRNFGAKLKVGRKSHVKKDEAAVAVFKKPA